MYYVLEKKKHVDIHNERGGYIIYFKISNRYTPIGDGFIF